MAVRLDEIRRAAERVAASYGLDVVDVEFAGADKQRTLRVSLEKNAAGRARERQERALAAAEGAEPAGGAVEANPAGTLLGKLNADQLSCLTHEDCVAFSRDFGTLLDVEDLVSGGEYTLEASSPGLDRKLTRREDFLRFAGCLVKVRTIEPVHNNRHWHGRLVAGPADGKESITVDLAAVKQNSKSRKSGGPNDGSSSLGKKSGAATVEIALANIERANLAPEI